MDLDLDRYEQLEARNEVLMLKFWAEHPVLLGVCILLGMGFVGAYPAVSLFVVAVVAGGYGLCRWMVRLDERSREQIWRRWGLVHRADYEHWLVMHGVPNAEYGQFPPYNAR